MTVRALTLAGTAVIALGAVSGGTASSTRWIVFAASPQHGTQPTQLFRVSTTGTGLRQITTGIRSADDPAFSPDGKRVVFTRALSGLFVMNVDGTGLRRLTGGRDDRYPVWSPNGRSIAFLHPLRNGFRLYLIKLNGRGQHRLRFAPKDVGRPSWLPDGKSILVPAGAAFYEVSATGGRVEKRLGPTYETGDGPPHWTLSPNGRTIAIVRPFGRSRPAVSTRGARCTACTSSMSPRRSKGGSSMPPALRVGPPTVAGSSTSAPLGWTSSPWRAALRRASASAQATRTL